jgi:hypothetical protein
VPCRPLRVALAQPLVSGARRVAAGEHDVKLPARADRRIRRGQDAPQRGRGERGAVGQRVPADRRDQGSPAGPALPAAYGCSRQRLCSKGV